MPNWCRNDLSIYCKKTEQTVEYIKKFSDAVKEGKLNEFVIPFKDMGNEEWDYSSCIEHWGTKWDADVHNLDENNEENHISIHVGYSTAWAPNIPVLERLHKILTEMDKDAEVNCTYSEPGMAFCGKFSNGWDEAWEITTLHSLLEGEYEEINIRETEETGKFLLEDDKFFIIKERRIHEEYSPIHDESGEYEEIECFSNYYNFGDGNVILYKWGDEYFIR